MHRKARAAGIRPFPAAAWNACCSGSAGPASVAARLPQSEANGDSVHHTDTEAPR